MGKMMISSPAQQDHKKGPFPAPSFFDRIGLHLMLEVFFSRSIIRIAQFSPCPTTNWIGHVTT